MGKDFEWKSVQQQMFILRSLLRYPCRSMFIRYMIYVNSFKKSSCLKILEWMRLFKMLGEIKKKWIVQRTEPWKNHKYLKVWKIRKQQMRLDWIISKIVNWEWYLRTQMKTVFQEKMSIQLCEILLIVYYNDNWKLSIKLNNKKTISVVITS